MAILLEKGGDDLLFLRIIDLIDLCNLMLPDIQPANMISNSVASSGPVTNAAFSTFSPYITLIVGVFAGIAVILILIRIFSWIYHRFTGTGVTYTNSYGRNFNVDEYKPILRTNFRDSRFYGNNNSWSDKFERTINSRRKY